MAKTEAAERPLRLNEATDLAGVLDVEVGYLLTPPLTGMSAVSQDFREWLRTAEILETLGAEVVVLQQQLEGKLADLKKPEKRFLTPEQVHQLADAVAVCPIPEVGGQYRPLVLVLAFCGLGWARWPRCG